MAYDYLSQSNSEQSHLESQIFALMLIDNAKLPPQTMNSLAIQLANDAKDRKDDFFCIAAIPIKRIERLLEIAKDVKNSYSRQSSIDAIKMNHIFQLHDETKKILDTQKSLHEKRGSVDYPIYLDDAASAVRKLDKVETSDEHKKQFREIKSTMMAMKRSHSKNL